jgi:chromosome segregation ATPase
MLIGFACLAVAGWYSQNQRVQALEGQLEEADYWARQSKLALARFEGDLSETGENLQQRGASLAEQMAANKKLLDTANSEIRKLWVVANERNKARLNKHQERLTAIEKDLAEDSQALAALTASVEKLQSSFSTDLAALQKQTQTSVSALQDADRQASDQLAALSKKVQGVDQLVDSKIRRFEQEQKLGIKGMESRITALEKAAGSNSQMQALQSELDRLKSTVQAIDSSRAQLTSRLVRLSEEVNALRAGQ